MGRFTHTLTLLTSKRLCGVRIRAIDGSFYGSVCVDTVVCEQTQDMRVREWGTSVDWAGERAPVGVNSPVWLHFLFCRRDAITTSLLITLLAPVLLPAPLRYLHRLLSLFLSPVLFNGRSQHRC